MRLLRRSRRSTVAGPGLLLLTRAADRGLLWLSIAAALGLGGGRRPRRAALRGVFGVALAAAVANGPLKLAFRSPRPAAARLLGHLPGFPHESTTSFPSGHTAAGFAFAVGAGQEVPALAAPLVGLAALVGYSRVHAGVHRRSDALAGAAVGVGAGLVTRRLWPVAPHEPAQVRTALARAEVEPSPAGKGVAIVVNPSAGSSERAAEELRAELPEAQVIELAEGDDLQDALRAASERGCVLGVVGGDGSVNTAAELAAGDEKPMLVVPGGTLNHFAYALGLDSIADAASAVRDGRAAAVDRALIDGHTFVNTASIGSYVELVDARETLEGRIGKWPAVVVALWGVLRRSEPIELELDGVRRKVWMIFVGNCRYDPPGFAPSWRERLDDGQLDIRIVDGTQPWSRARLLLSVLTGRLANCGAYEQRYVRRMEVRSLAGPLRLARDGETFDGPEEFTICKADDPLLVYVPEE
ncbi:MAG TPA: phosphatase PAP2 family protein [Acidimicrobiales bacterium]|nr:phosphatase PAP2 family protein [Acidimicrobiales bacterium]